MPRPRLWTDTQLIWAVQQSNSIYQVAKLLEIPVSGHTYKSIRDAADRLGLDMSRYPRLQSGRMKRYRTWTDNELHDVVAISRSVAEVMRRLGYNPSGGVHRWLTGHIRRLEISTEHFVGQGWAKGKKLPPGPGRIPLEELLRENVQYSPSRLRTRLVAAGLKANRCEECGLDSWRGKPLPLVLDHVNGDHLDNRLENLRILCPNCHSQTPTWCGKGRSLKRQSKAGVVQLAGDAAFR